MNGVLEVLLAIAVVVWVIVRQLMGEPLRGKKLIVLPLVLTGVGVLSLTKHGVHPGAADIVCLAVGTAIAVAIGLGQGRSMRLEARDGVLWGRMPARGLLWWVALIGSRLLMTAVAHGMDAKVAASTAPLLMVLGANRVGQALAIAPRAMRGPVPFAPEKDGSTFPSGSGGLRSGLLSSGLLSSGLLSSGLLSSGLLSSGRLADRFADRSGSRIGGRVGSRPGSRSGDGFTECFAERAADVRRSARPDGPAFGDDDAPTAPYARRPVPAARPERDRDQRRAARRDRRGGRR
ncbi:hypothetical protein GXW83_03445 [Streptacidiphilus sp. PB12-B1b]|uniref:hypothetical protein n=1 Tax=Streptacidiphilus sp. PB12-B1b TaxID=2705012 RepID=UPI0015F92FBF|nr:hypothetical protein [Streptacidiphilus sp. PB12-B1b]QMU74957.1 hypothetical protein GXW83_03445 [Streptacidiphilus sp. PB12-B1b]